MTRYKITNESNVGRSYVNSHGQRIHFEPGQTKRLASRPPEDEAWRIEEIEEPNQKPGDNKESGGEN